MSVSAVKKEARAAQASVSFLGNVQFDQTMEEAFPVIDPGFIPFGSRVLVQIKAPAMASAGGIELPIDTQRAQAWNCQVAKVVQMGPVAFCNRDSLAVWPEGKWCQPGSFVRIPIYGGQRWEIPCRGGVVLLAVFNDLDIIGEITGDPRDVVAFL